MTTPTTNGPAVPAESRRRASARRTPAWLGIFPVAIVAGALALAGTTDRPAGTATTEEPGRPNRVERAFACTGGIPQTEALTGAGDMPRVAGVGDDPVVETVPPEQSAAAWAGQTARSDRWLAYLPCPEPRPRWWFVGAGASGTHGSTLTLVNTRSGEAVVDIDVWGPDGQVPAPGLRGVTIAPGEHRRLELSNVAPAVGDLAVRVETTRGLISASLADRYAPDVIGEPVQEWVAPRRRSTRRVVVTGLPPRPSGASVLVANPGENRAVVTIEAIGSGGTFVPEKAKPVVVPAGTVLTAPLQGYFDGRPVALVISSDKRVVAALRAVNGADVSFGAQGRALSGEATLAVPEGVEARVVLSSLGEAGSARVRAIDARGRRLGKVRTLRTDPGASAEVTVPGGAVAVVVTPSGGGLVAGLLLQAGDRTAGAAFAGPEAAGVAPAVRPGW